MSSILFILRNNTPEKGHKKKELSTTIEILDSPRVGECRENRMENVNPDVRVLRVNGQQ